MTSNKTQKVDFEPIVSLFRTVPKAVLHIRQYSDWNNTIEISSVGIVDEVDRPDPLRIPEVIIVVGVLLLWCASIFIFIRHSELLRIRHRDIPYRSSGKSMINLNHSTVINRASDLTIQAKSRVSSMGGLTPPISNTIYHGFKHRETNETISLIIPSAAFNKRRHTHSFDFNSSLSRKYLSEKNNHKEHYLHPHRISSDIKQSSVNLHRKSMDNMLTIKHPTFYSTNDILISKPIDNADGFMSKKRCIHESPV